MALPLYEVKLDPASYPAIALLNKLEGRNIGRLSTEQKVVALTNRLGDLALAAFKSYVPVDTYELRGGDVPGGFGLISRTAATQKHPVYTVIVKDQIHKGIRGKPKYAPLLVQMLNEGRGERNQPLHRSRLSDAISPYSAQRKGRSTAGWVVDAQKAANAESTIFLSKYSLF